MKYYLVLIISSLLIGCGNAQDKVKNDLIGVWGNSEDGGKTFWGYDEYLPNGTLFAWGTLPGSHVSYNIEASYNIKKEAALMSCLTINKSSEPEFIPVGLYWCDEIVEVNSGIFKFKDEDGEVTTLYKQKNITRPSI